MNDPKSDITSKPGSSGWHVALERATTDKPYLGDPVVVGQLVRAFVAGILNRYAEVVDGRLDRRQAAASDRAECERLGRVFAGLDDHYSPVGHWSGPGLAAALRREMAGMLAEDADTDDLSAITQGMAVVAHRVYDALRALPVTEHPTEDGKAAMQAIVDYASGLMAGVSS